MELLGEEWPAGILQDYDNRIPLSIALRFLNEEIDRTRAQETDPGYLALRILFTASKLPGPG